MRKHFMIFNLMTSDSLASLHQMKVKQITPMGTHKHPHKGFFLRKCFLLVYLFTTSFNISHQESNICGKTIFFSSIHFFRHSFFWILEVGRKVVMEPVFNMGRDFKAQLSLYAPPGHTNLTQSWCTNSGIARTRITSSIMGKVAFTITPLE